MELWFSFCGKGKLKEVIFIKRCRIVFVVKLEKKDRLVWKE